MTIQQYQVDAKRTCPDLGEKLNLCHMVLGIGSEFEEYVNAIDEINKSEECSDMCWYLANYCTFREISFYALFLESKYNEKSFVENVSLLQDFTKKYIAYGKEINSDKEYEVLKGLMYNIQHMYGDITILNSLENNIAKLRVRFPEKFDEKLALNRNLEAERIELEK